jgi:hypothetical protein
MLAPSTPHPHPTLPSEKKRPRTAQVHNTYGEHSNAELLRKYGFALPANPFDSVTLDADALVAAAAAAHGGGAAGAREARRRVRWIQQHRCAGGRGRGGGNWVRGVGQTIASGRLQEEQAGWRVQGPPLPLV